MAAIASTIGEALGKMQGSCLPFSSKRHSLPIKSTVFCCLPIVETGLKATLKYLKTHFFNKYYMFIILYLLH